MKKMLLISIFIGGILFAVSNPNDVESSLNSMSAAPDSQFQKVNGISLGDDMKTVVTVQGEPAQKVKDTFFTELETYEYPGMNVGFAYGVVQYVEVLVNANRTIQIDHLSMDATEAGLKAALGIPDYITEDGYVYHHQGKLVKLYLDFNTEKVKSIHYYHRTS